MNNFENFYHHRNKHPVHSGETFVLQHRYCEICGKPQKRKFRTTLLTSPVAACTKKRRIMCARERRASAGG